jgi:hypothetical protein
LQACLEKVQTVVIYPGNTSPDSPIKEDDKDTWKYEETWSSGSNILGLIVSALAFGVAIAVVGKEGEPGNITISKFIYTGIFVSRMMFNMSLRLFFSFNIFPIGYCNYNEGNSMDHHIGTSGCSFPRCRTNARNERYGTNIQKPRVVFYDCPCGTAYSWRNRLASYLWYPATKHI